MKALFSVVFLVILLPACRVSKESQSRSTDSTHTVKVDTGAVKKTTEAEQTTADWQRQILIYNRDTTVNNYIYSGTSATPTIDYSRLAAIINESGSYQNNSTRIIYDSSWRQAYDSLALIIKETTKNKESQPQTGRLILLALLVIGIVLMLRR